MAVSEFAAATAVGFACGLVLNVFYIVVRHAWPQNYFGLDGTVDPIVSRNILRYTLFRFAPPFIMAAAASLTSERLGYSAALGVSVAVLVHVIRPLHDVMVRVQRRQWGPATGRMVIVLGVFGAAALAFVIRGSLSAVVPRPSDLVANLWAGALAAIGAVYLQGVVLVKADPGAIVLRSFREINSGLGRYAVSASKERAVHPSVCLAIMAAENAQRPRWVRRLERLIPPKWRTSGVMQQLGARDDRESVDFALERCFVSWGTPERSYGGNGIDEQWFEEKAMQYNHDVNFAALARTAMEVLNNNPIILRRFEGS